MIATRPACGCCSCAECLQPTLAYMAAHVDELWAGRLVSVVNDGTPKDLLATM